LRSPGLNPGPAAQAGRVESAQRCLRVLRSSVVGSCRGV